MAKICGIFDKDSSTDDKTIKSMAQSMMLFDGYKEDYLDEGEISLCSLFLDNESSGMFESKDGKTIVIFDGYLLDQDSNKAPAEIILDLFTEKGKDFVKNLNGVFNIVIYQKDKKKLYVFNDRYGMLPLYYYTDKERFIFASEVKAVIKNKNVPREINWQAWADYFSFRYLLGNKTFFKRVESLPNASILTYEGGRVSIKEYWDYSRIKIDCNHDEGYFVKTGQQLVKEAVEKSAAGVKKAMCFLSGGYDSRCLASALKKYTDIGFVTYTTEHPTGPKDQIIAKKVAQKMGVENKFIKHPRNLYQKFFLRKLYLIDGMAQEHLWALPLSAHLESGSIVFDGLAGDLFLKGLFLDDYNIKFIKNTKKLSSVLYDQYGYSLLFIKKFFKKEARDQSVFSEQNLLEELQSAADNENRVTAFFAKNRTRNAMSLCSNNIFFNLIKRFPFLDNNLVEFSLSIPPEMKVKNHIYQKILERSFPEVMRIPSTNDGTVKKTLFINLGRTLIRLRVQRFFKFLLKNLLFRKSLSDDDVRYLRSLISNMEIPDYINKGLVDRHLRRGKVDFAFFCLVEHLLWHNMFYEGDKWLSREML